jgi:HEAT repeat protein
MGWADSVGEIASVLSEGDELLAPAAATALANHASADALQPLIEGAQSAIQHSRHAALVGLRHRGNPAACAHIAPLLDHSDPITRYQSLRTLADLGCLQSDDTQRLAQDDDPDVKALAEELLNPAE